MLVEVHISSLDLQIYRGYHESVFWDRKYPALGINIVFCEPWRAKYIVFIPNAGYLRSQNTRA